MEKYNNPIWVKVPAKGKGHSDMVMILNAEITWIPLMSHFLLSIYVDLIFDTSIC